jgi:Family of unknown function (DUF5906)/Bifunctional DNA primase/polymerase, N-terminal
MDQVQNVNFDLDIERLWKKYWLSGIRPLVPDIPPGAPLSERSGINPFGLGKIPGEQGSDGTWHGLDCLQPDYNPDKARVKRWAKSGASIGIRGDRYPALDGDIDHKKASQAVRERAVRRFGFTAVCTVEGRNRWRMTFRCDEDTPKERFAFEVDGEKCVVEWLGRKQQYVAEGMHKSGKPYRWEDDAGPCEWGDKIPLVPQEDIRAFFDEDLPAVVQELGGRILTKRTGSGGGARLKLDDARLHAPSLAIFRKALASIDMEKLEEGRDDAVRFVAAAKAASYPWLMEAVDDIRDKFFEHPDANDDDYFLKIYESVNDADLGWSWLLDLAREHGYVENLEEIYDDDIAKEAAADIAKNGRPEEAARAAMLDDHVWVRSVGRHYNTKDGGFLDTRAFNAENTDVVPFGRAAGQNAEAVFMNHAKARKVITVTLRPGAPVITTAENEYGIPVSAANLWRPSKVEPAENVSDEQVAPWLDLVEKHYGPEGTIDREHLLNCLAFKLQQPDGKLGHAPLIIGRQKTGKDSLLRPFFEGVGLHNVATISPETIAGQFNDFLKKPVIYGEEIITYGRRDLYNKLKSWISRQVTRLRVNEKHLPPYYVENHHFWILVSNYDNAIALDDDDRRFCVLQVRLETPPLDHYFSKYHSWLDNGGTELVVGWLKQRDLSNFDPGAAPPMTAAKQVMIEQSQPKEVQWLREQFRDGGPFANRTVLAVNDLLEAADAADWNAPPGIRDKHAIAALKAEGFKSAHQVRIDKDFRRLWVCDPAGKLGTYSTDMLREQYLAEGKVPHGGW